MPGIGRHEVVGVQAAHRAVQGFRERRARALLGLDPRQFEVLVASNAAGFALAEVRADAGHSRDSRLVYANAAYALHMGVSPADVVGLWLSDVLPREDQAWLAVNDHMFRTGASFEFVMRQHLADRWVQVRCFPVAARFAAGWILDVSARYAVGRVDVVQVGELVVRLAEHRALLRGRLLDLTPAEFAILSVLARSAGAVCQIPDIPGRGAAERPGRRSACVEVHVSRLRRKLGESAAQPVLLHTVRGVGYRLGVARTDLPVAVPIQFRSA